MKLLFGTLGVVGILILVCLNGLFGSLLWPYTINSWLVYMHKDPVVVWWQGFLLAYVPYIGQTYVVTAILTWIAMLFLR
jgi:hypothetical protein